MKSIATVTIPRRPGKCVARADHSWNYFDGSGWRTFSNENGGVWTRYFYDGQGNITQEVRFQRRDAAGQFTDAIFDVANRPSLATLEADYAAAQAAHRGKWGSDTNYHSEMP